MRTTVTLDPDVLALVRKLMDRRGLSFKAAVNLAIRQGLASAPQEPFVTPSFPMGFDPAIDLDKALAAAGALEDEELIRKLAARK